jgi:methyltransferase (TIGR00027 family)
MARTDDDSWDLATSVGATATMVAAYRAVATRRQHPLISDPFAEPLVRAVGIDVFTRLASGELEPREAGEFLSRMTDVFTSRTRFFDEFMTSAVAAGIRQVVVLAAGLDARSYRLAWPAGTTVYEIDQPEVIEFKTTTLSGLGAVPTVELRTVGIDLRQDWRAALVHAGFDPATPTAWLAEGLMIGFLPPDAQDALVNAISGLSATGSRIGCDYLSSADRAEAAQEQMRTVGEGWREHGLDLDIADLTYTGERQDVAEQLRSLGWDAVGANINDLLAASGLPLVEGDDQRAFDWIVYVQATRK